MCVCACVCVQCVYCVCVACVCVYCVCVYCVCVACVCGVCVLQSQTEQYQTKGLLLLYLGITFMYMLCCLGSRQLVTSSHYHLQLLISFLHSRGCSSSNKLPLSLSLPSHRSELHNQHDLAMAVKRQLRKVLKEYERGFTAMHGR